MKPIILLIVLLLAIGVRAQTHSSCTPSALLSHSYGDDVKDLALSRIYALHSADTAFVEIPQPWQDTVMSGIASICNLDTALQADSIFNIYCIHTKPHGFINYSLRVKVDSSLPWTTAWRHLNATTGYAALDAFMSRYNFTVVAYDTLSSHEYLRHFATITTNRAINTKAFADSLALFTGISQVNFNFVAGDGNRIIYTRDTVSHFVFTLGWGDCMAGCTSTKQWQYSVNSNCDVTLNACTTYLGSPHDSPTKFNCNLVPLSQPLSRMDTGFTVYPNPAENLLHLNTNTSGNYLYTLQDIAGRSHLSGTAGGQTVLNLAGLPSGMYMLIISDANGHMWRKKVVKHF